MQCYVVPASAATWLLACRASAPVDWKGNGVWSSSSKGINTYTSPGFTQMQEGTSRTASATATGTIVGVPIPLGAEGTIGSSHNLLITVTN